MAYKQKIKKKNYFIQEPFGLPRELQEKDKFYTVEEEKSLKEKKEDRAMELVFNIVQNTKNSKQNKHLKYAYDEKISDDKMELRKLVGKKKADKMLKESYENWID
jgi:hypothetical protein